MTSKPLNILQEDTPLNIKKIRSLWLSLWRFSLFAIWTVCVLSIQSILYALKLNIGYKTPMFFHKIYCKILGLTLQIEGKKISNYPILFVSNHVSYLDISVLGSLLQSGFIAKKEIKNWPIFGLLTRIGHSVFIERKREKAYVQKQEILACFKQNRNLTLFPEGTSNDGNRVYPFKSSLFSVIDQTHQDIMIQPISIAYTKLNGLPIGRQWRPLYAWYGDMALFGHLFFFLGLGKSHVKVTFHPPIEKLDLIGSQKRKKIAHLTYHQINEGHSKALSL